MAIEEFTWCARVNASGQSDFDVRTIQFGDGYSQSAEDGINSRHMTWNLQFTGDETFIGEIKAFLNRQMGYKSFQWTPPGEALGLYRCVTYNPTALGAGLFDLTATFTQAFAP
jgi:Phage-related protein